MTSLYGHLHGPIARLSTRQLCVLRLQISIVCSTSQGLYEDLAATDDDRFLRELTSGRSDDETWKLAWFYPYRTARCYRNHRDSGSNTVPRLRGCAGVRAQHKLP